MSSIVYGAHATWCALCHRPPRLCTCERDSAGVLDLMRALDPPVSLQPTPDANAALLEETRGDSVQPSSLLRLACIAATPLSLEHRGVRYAVTWEGI